MSSTSNAQDLLVNVFRPTYKWDSNTGFVPSLVVSNVTELIASRIKTSALVVSDSNVNTYIGSNAGVNASNTLSNVGIGFSAMGGALNATCNVAIGTFSLDGLANSDSNVAIGAGTDISGVGTRNVLIGTNVGLTTGVNNILIGVDLSRTNVSNTLQIGPLLYGDLSQGFFGVNTSAPTAPLDVSGNVLFRNKVAIQRPLANYSLDVGGSLYVSSQVLAERGSVGVPPYSFDSNKTTGLYQPTDLSYGAAALGVAVNGVSRLVVADISTYVYGGLDVCGAVRSSGGSASFLAEKGTAAVPAYSFSSNTGLGFYTTTDASGAAIGIAVGGQQRLVVGSAKMTMYGNLDVCGAFNAVSGGGGSGGGTVASNGTSNAPSFTFSNDSTTGLYLQSASNLGFATGGARRMTILNTGDVSAGQLVVSQYIRNVTNGTRTLDISGGGIYNSGWTESLAFRTLASTFLATDTRAEVNTAAAVTALIVCNAVGRPLYIKGSNSQLYVAAPTAGNETSITFERATGSMRIGNNVGSVGDGVFALSNTNVVLSADSNSVAIPTIRNALTPSTYDISGGNISNSGTTTSTNILASGYLRNALIPTQFDISGGNISNSGLHRSSNFRAADGTASVPTYSFASDTTTGLYGSTGFLAFATGGTQRLSMTTTEITAALPLTGSTITANTRFAANGSSAPQIQLAGGGPPSTNTISFATAGGPTLQIGNRAGGGTDGQFAVSADSGSTSSFSVATSGVIVPGHIRNALTPTQFDISGGNISNSATTTSSNFIGTKTASNWIGGVTLSNSNVGIGTTAPAFALDVSGSANIQAGNGAGALYVGGSSTGVVVQRDVGGNGYVRSLGSGVNLYLGTSNTNTMTILSTGLVGVGTTTPGYTLDVNGTTSASNYIGTATTSNQIGGVTMNSRQVNVAIPPSTDTFLVAGGDSTVAALVYSTDGGTTWNAPADTIFTVYYNAAWNGTIWVASGQGPNTLAFSYDGKKWFGLGKSIFSNGCRSVCWGNGLFVATGSGGNTMAVSQNGINWIGLGNILFSVGGNSIAYGGGYFVATGDGAANSLAWSANGIAWTGLGKTYFTTYGTFAAYNGAYWVAVGVGTNTSAAYTAADPTATWTKRTLTGTDFSWTIAWNGTSWMVGSQGTNKISMSTDGINWTGYAIAELGTVTGLCWTGSLWVAGGSGTSKLATSPDGVNWTARLTSSVLTANGQNPAARRFILPITTGAVNAPTYTPLDISDGYIRVPSTVQSADFRGGSGSQSYPSYSFTSDLSSGLYLRGTSVLEFTTAGAARMCISGASVGIGVTAPAYTLQLGTDSAAKPSSGTWTISSDRRIKRNIQPADTSLCYDIVKRLPLQRFTWDASYMPNVPDKKSVGWIAQDVSDVFPRAITRVSNEWFQDFHSLDVDQIYKTMYGALEKVIADKEALEAKLTRVLARLATVEAALDISEAPVDVSGEVMDVSGTGMDVSGEVMDVSGTGMDVSGEVVDVSGTAMDVSGEVVDVSGTGMDVSGEVVDVSGEVMDVSGASPQSSESTQPTPQTPPQPEEPPAASPEPQPQPSSEYAPAPAETEA